MTDEKPKGAAAEQPATTGPLRVDEPRDAGGREARRHAPRSTLGGWTPASDRVPAVELLAAQEATRVPELVPLRHERMAASAFSFYRGAANVMAADLSTVANTGLTVQLCGDAHLANFGVFAAPDRSLVFDLNDFDETLPGPFEWDVARLAASIEVAARANGFDRRQRERAVSDTVGSYAAGIREFAEMGHLQVWYARLTPEVVAQRWGADATAPMIERLRRTVEKAQRKDRLRAFDKLVTTEGGTPRFRNDPPVLVPVSELFGTESVDRLVDTIEHALAMYRRSLSPELRSLVDRYRFVDLARKVVGVGSVGTRCWVALMVGRSEADPLFLQVKEAEASVLEPYLGRSRYEQHGQRVVDGQRRIQAATDIFLGWERMTRVDDGGISDYYFRQLWDAKGSAEIETMSTKMLSLYGRLCGHVLARAHARTGDAVAIASYLGRSDAFSRSLVQFAATYADQNERDHAAFCATVAPAAS